MSGLSSNLLFRYPHAGFAKNTGNKKLTSEKEDSKEATGSLKNKRVSKKSAEEQQQPPASSDVSGIKKTKKNAKV